MEICDQLFLRSHLFRHLTMQHLPQLLEHAVGTKASRPLPGPADVANKLHEKALESIDQWTDKFGAYYQQVHIRSGLSLVIAYMGRSFSSYVPGLAMVARHVIPQIKRFSSKLPLHLAPTWSSANLIVQVFRTCPRWASGQHAQAYLHSAWIHEAALEKRCLLDAALSKLSRSLDSGLLIEAVLCCSCG